MKKPTIAAAAGCFLLLIAITANALVDFRTGGNWPNDWPKALDPLRDHARTIGVADGTQENIYEITFSDRAEFEKAWPTILSLKTPGAPLRLYGVGKLPSYGLGEMESNAAPIVRIYAPVPSEMTAHDGEKLKTSPPWPKDLYGSHGELPEYVVAKKVDGKLRWVPVDGTAKEPLFHFRARVDIDLVIDGKVIDLNRVKLPADTPIEDHRF